MEKKIHLKGSRLHKDGLPGLLTQLTRWSCHPLWSQTPGSPPPSHTWFSCVDLGSWLNLQYVAPPFILYSQALVLYIFLLKTAWEQQYWSQMKIWWKVQPSLNMFRRWEVTKGSQQRTSQNSTWLSGNTVICTSSSYLDLMQFLPHPFISNHLERHADRWKHELFTFQWQACFA